MAFCWWKKPGQQNQALWHDIHSSVSLSPTDPLSLFIVAIFCFLIHLTSAPPPLTSLPISPRPHWFRFFYIWVQTLFSCVSYCPTALHGSPVKLDHFLKRVWMSVCVHVCLAYMIPGKSPWCILHFPLMSCSVEAIIASDYFSVSHSGQPTRPQICREHGGIDRYKNLGCNGGRVLVFRKSTVCCLTDHGIFSVTSFLALSCSTPNNNEVELKNGLIYSSDV